VTDEDVFSGWSATRCEFEKAQADRTRKTSNPRRAGTGQQSAISQGRNKNKNEEKQLANSNWQLAKKPKAKSQKRKPYR
jgi:hypothetical protein